MCDTGPELFIPLDRGFQSSDLRALLQVLTGTVVALFKAKATITEVQLVKAAEIFKDKAKDPEQRLYAIHGRVNDREMRIATSSKPQAEEISSKSRLAQFKQRYKRFPTLGMKVDVVTDDNGYWKIAL